MKDKLALIRGWLIAAGLATGILLIEIEVTPTDAEEDPS